MSSMGEILKLSHLYHPFTILAGLLLLVIFIYWSGTSGYAVLKEINLPGPKPVPFFGNILEVTKAGGLHKYQVECIKKYGKVFTQCIGSRVGIVVADPEILKQVMVKEFSNFQDRLFGFTFPPPMEYSVLLASGDTWRRIRGTLTPSFSSSKLKQMVKLIEEAADKLVMKLEEVADTGIYNCLPLVSVLLGISCSSLISAPPPQLLQYVPVFLSTTPYSPLSSLTTFPPPELQLLPPLSKESGTKLFRSVGKLLVN